jgi:BirA family transcriptional regulator, biotin operon repressor / biotin---[acetyl-CoA-carboxylase] ligase
LPELTSSPLSPFFIELQQVDSTNNYALALLNGKVEPQLPLRQGMPAHGTAIFAYEQTAGKGQYGKNWHSEKGENIMMSILLSTLTLKPADQFHLSICAAVSLFEFFSNYAGPGISIKWPNDLYTGIKKAGGILIENQLKLKNGLAEWPWSVVGFGVNINQVLFPESLPGAISLKQVTGTDYDVIFLAKDLQRVFLHYADKLFAGEFEEVYKVYLAHLYKKNETVKLKKGNRVFEARIKTVLPSGKLVVQTGMDEEFSAGEIEWIS